MKLLVLQVTMWRNWLFSVSSEGHFQLHPWFNLITAWVPVSCSLGGDEWDNNIPTPSISRGAMSPYLSGFAKALSFYIIQRVKCFPFFLLVLWLRLSTSGTLLLISKSSHFYSFYVVEQFILRVKKNKQSLAFYSTSNSGLEIQFGLWEWLISIVFECQHKLRWK